MTQGELVFRVARRRALTYLDMLCLVGGGLSPWKRLTEHLRHQPDFRIVKGSRKVGKNTLVTWRVVKVKA